MYLHSFSATDTRSEQAFVQLSKPFIQPKKKKREKKKSLCIHNQKRETNFESRRRRLPPALGCTVDLLYLLCVRECMWHMCVSVRVCERVRVCVCVWSVPAPRCDLCLVNVSHAPVHKGPGLRASSLHVVDCPQRDTVEHFDPKQTPASFFGLGGSDGRRAVD